MKYQKNVSIEQKLNNSAWLGTTKYFFNKIKISKPLIKKGRWTKEEDSLIISLKNQGVTKWSEIACKIPGRIGKQCRDRWYNQLNPEISKLPWTQEEDAKLISLHKKYGNHWMEIAKELQGLEKINKLGRTDNNIKNRWNHYIKVRLSSDGSVQEEELSKLVNIYK